ncbi:hypothetical protein K438DRAFT_2017434 [Mycena galopus ATCC 62051]|nr:hypothetical protein K438DRAFT_2017434 [Mycena galopus ATCC 62051]
MSSRGRLGTRAALPDNEKPNPSTGVILSRTGGNAPTALLSDRPLPSQHVQIRRLRAEYLWPSGLLSYRRRLYPRRSFPPRRSVVYEIHATNSARRPHRPSAAKRRGTDAFRRLTTPMPSAPAIHSTLYATTALAPVLSPYPYAIHHAPPPPRETVPPPRANAGMEWSGRGRTGRGGVGWVSAYSHAPTPRAAARSPGLHTRSRRRWMQSKSTKHSRFQTRQSMYNLPPLAARVSSMSGAGRGHRKGLGVWFAPGCQD